jgi:hypothetical protein
MAAAVFEPIKHSQRMLDTRDLFQPQPHSLALGEGQGELLEFERCCGCLAVFDHADEPFAAGLDHFDGGWINFVALDVIHRNSPQEQWETSIFISLARSVFQYQKLAAGQANGGERGQRNHPCLFAVQLTSTKGTTMADNETPKISTREAQEALEKQVASLKREISKIKRTLADRAEEAVEEAGGWYGSATERAARAAQQLRSQAQTVSETVQQNPGTISSAFVLGGITGLLIGLLLGQTQERDRRWF